MVKTQRLVRKLVTFAGSLLFIVSYKPFLTSAAPTTYATITSNNVEDLELGYALPGVCGYFSPDGNLLLVWENGLYDLPTGEQRIADVATFDDFSPDSRLVSITQVGIFDTTDGRLIYPMSGESRASFSRDNTLFAVAGDGVYERSTTQRRFPISSYANFSPDSRFVFVAQDGLYDTATGTRTFPLSDSFVEFSPDSQLLVTAENIVYETATHQRRFSTYGNALFFSPDGKYLAASNDGVYDTATGQKLFAIPDEIYDFSPDSTLIAVRKDGVYETATGVRRFDISEYGLFSLDSSWFAVIHDGVYDTATGKKRFSIKGNPFSRSQDSTLITVDREGVYDTRTGKLRFGDPKSIVAPMFSANMELAVDFRYSEEQGSSCLIYGLPGYRWQYRSAIVKGKTTIHLYDSPHGSIVKDTNEELIVFERSEDNAWLKIGDDLWIQAAAVDPIPVLEDIPVASS